MSGIENEKYFLLFLLHNSNKRQSTSILKTITNSQYSLLKSFANDILDEMIPLNSMQFKKLVQYKDFIRKLSGRKVSPATLSRNIECIKAIISVVLNEYEVCNKTNLLIPIEEWEKVKKHLPAKNILNTVEVDQAPQMKKKEEIVQDNGTKQMEVKRKKKHYLKVMDRKKKNAISIINHLPKKYRSKAFSLFRYILKNYNISWDNKGTFKYKNKIVPNSNILHLVTHALLKNIEDKPPGMKLFYEALSDVNIPEYLIANKMGKLIIAGRGDELSGKLSGKVDKKKCL